MAIKGVEFNGLFSIDGNGPNGQNTVHAQRMLEGTLSYEANTEDIEGHVDGNCVAQVLETLKTSETYTLSIGTRDIDSGFLELIMDERWAQSPGYDMAYIGTAAIDVATSTISSVELIPGLTIPDVQASIVTSSTLGLMRPLEVISTGTPTTEQVLLTPSAAAGGTGTLTFNPAIVSEGTAVKFSVARTQTVETLGFKADGVLLKNMSFFAELCMTSTERVYMRCRSMTKSGGFEFDLKGTGNATLEFKVKALPGFRRPVEFARLAY
ncbi:MAG: hypothetical protein HC771_16130 [Synechococcales cyanobacterium CRU_2_2]|nr:hypothetical protein [Synechococcales cyanobacterium CRU_2_2]